MSLVLLILVLTLSSSKATSISSGSRSILRDISDVAETNVGETKDFAVDINAKNFDAVFKGTPSTYAIVEFFAHWCPACRNYKPHYEKVARLFNGPEAVYPDTILMTRVDCADKTNRKLCENYSVTHYPMLYWGPPSNFHSGWRWETNQAKKDIVRIDDGRTADNLLYWINEKLGSTYNLDDKKFVNENLQTNISDTSQIAKAIHDIEEATATAFDIILLNKMIKTETRSSLIRFLQLIVAHHPSKRCRKGSADILVNFDDICSPDTCSPQKQVSASVNGKVALENFHICGKEVPRGYWMFCRGSRNETRGFSCGLWVLMHSLSVRVEDDESQFTFLAVCDFIYNFFVCEECRLHFHEMCLSVTTPFKKARDFSMWLWDAHNKVNERLSKEESSLKTGDPMFPKSIWPSEQLCSSCYLSQTEKDDNKSNHINWNQDKVYKWLTVYYGNSLVSLYNKTGILGEEKTDAATEEVAVATNVVMVPVGAALAIALASCAFGALACYWRSRQKNRKYYHQLHSLKNV